MDAKKISIATLLYQKMPFIIPKYQRSYSWEDDEIDDFINDIIKVYKNEINGVSDNQHFFGGIVTISQHDFEVIDGQQRLTTFMITIALMVHMFDNISKQAADEKDMSTSIKAKEYMEETRKDYFQYRDIEASQDRIRLTLSKSDRSFFEEIVIYPENTPKATRDSHKRLLIARRMIKENLFDKKLGSKHTNAKEKLEILLKIRKSILDKCYVINIVSNNKSEAYQLFATLNDRGKSLSTGDLLRAHTLELLEGFESVQLQVESCWDAILEYKQSDIKHFLESYYVSHTGVRASPRAMFDDYIKMFFDHDRSSLTKDKEISRNIGIRVQNMKDEEEIFLKIKDAQWPYETSNASIWQKDRLYRLIKILKHDLSLPLLVSAAVCLPESGFSNLINLLERFIFRYVTIVDAHMGKASEIYYKTSVSIRKNTYTLQSFLSELQDLSNKHANDSLFEASLKTKIRYVDKASQQNRIIKHFLSTLEDFEPWINSGANGIPAVRDQTKSLDINELTIEHIYPQNSPILEAAMEPLKHTIGNLTLLGPDNSKLGNKIFTEKKPFYSNSNIKITQLISSESQWTEIEIEKRTRNLIKKALKIFSL